MGRGGTDGVAQALIDFAAGNGLKIRQAAARVRAQPVEGRWCGSCGGELAHARRRYADRCEIVTYVRCLFCGESWPVLVYDILTGRDRVPGETQGGE